MATLDSSLQRLSFDEIRLACEYLKITDINELSLTCRSFYHHLFVHSYCVDFSHLMSGEGESNILYCSEVVQKLRKFEEGYLPLKLVKFTFWTKDQGWVSECESGSWIELEGGRGEEGRMPLVWNYEVPDFARKEKVLRAEVFEGESEEVGVYLRSAGRDWTIACRKAQIVCVYTKEHGLREKQLERERVVMKKKRRVGRGNR